MEKKETTLFEGAKAPTTPQTELSAQQLATEEKGTMVYMSGNEQVTLSRKIVKDYLLRGNGNVTPSDLVLFMTMCKVNALNPFLNEAYLVKFGDQPAQMIVGKDAYMKRADQCPQFVGMQSGIIVADKEGNCKELSGCFCPPNHTLVGGWATVEREDRKYPVQAKVSLSEYNKGTATWKSIPSTMIKKVAEVQALREAFPSQLSGMYVQEEAQWAEATEIKDGGNGKDAPVQTEVEPDI